MASIVTEFIEHPLSKGNPPKWASGWGQDRFGPWVEISVGNATQKLRWIHPFELVVGREVHGFLGRPVEGDMRKVLVSSGFWIFDSPCTQGLWEAVMGENPSWFKNSTDRTHMLPVENVGWLDCHEFVSKIQSNIPGLKLRLPNADEWDIALYAVLSFKDYVENLSSIGWYRKNSASSTHPVGEKLPNAFGLYDMLGNVQEWCADNLYELTDHPDAFKQEPDTRVVRGGSWASRKLDWSPFSWEGSNIDRRDRQTGFRCCI